MGIILSVNIEYKEEETMDIIKKFGEMVGSTSLKDAKKARKLLLLGYQLQEKRLLLFPDKKLRSVCGTNCYAKYHQSTFETGGYCDGQHLCAGRTSDSGRTDALLRRSNVLFYCGNAVRAAIFKENRGGRFSGDDVFVSPCIFGRIFDRAGSGAEMHGLYKSCL